MAGTVIIVGGTGGIGSALARRLVQRGLGVHLVGRDQDKLKSLSDAIGASWALADVMDGDALARAVVAAPGLVSGLAYAVGSINLRPLPRLGLADFMDDFRLNAAGAAIAVQAALPAMKAAGEDGSVVLFSTVAVRQGFARLLKQ